jgi:Tfp pilus assembly PilM family ATPase
MLLAETRFGRFRILRQESVDLQEEGLVSPEETRSHITDLLEDLGNPAVALTLPQHISTSQVIELPDGSDAEIQKLIQDETTKLAGVSESRIIYDFAPLGRTQENRRQFWVTLCQEAAVRDRILQLGMPEEDLCEITTTANALISSFRAVHPAQSNAILVGGGAQSTVVVILVEGHGAFASSFEMGGDFFTRSLARSRNSNEESAERLKRSANLLAGPEADAKFVATVDGWVQELARQLQDWFSHNRQLGLKAAQFPVIVCGSLFQQPGLLEFLKNRMELRIERWGDSAERSASLPGTGFEVAHGLALQSLGFGTHPVSLLPEDFQERWRHRLARERIETVSVLLLIACALLLFFGTWRHAMLAATKKHLLDKVTAGQAASDANDALTADLLSGYETFRPLFASQQNTHDFLSALGLLQQARGTNLYWYVLLADQRSYFLAPANSTGTNKNTKLSATGAERNTANSPSGLAVDNAAHPGLIAELCIPSDAEMARVTLSQLVKELKQKPLFAKVDLLSEDLKRELADPKVVVTNRDYSLVLDFAITNFNEPPPRVRIGPSARHPQRRTPRQTPDSMDRRQVVQ